MKTTRKKTRTTKFTVLPSESTVLFISSTTKPPLAYSSNNIYIFIASFSSARTRSTFTFISVDVTIRFF